MKITSPADFDRLGYIGAITELEPASGAFAPICPPTYMKDGAASWAEKLALTEDMTIPSREHMWADVERDAQGCPRREKAVLINSIGAEAHQLSQILLRDSGIEWGRIAVNPMDATAVDEHITKNLKHVPESDVVRDVVRETLAGYRYDSWGVSHRFADALIRYAQDPSTSSQVRKNDNPLWRKILSVDPQRDADWLWCNAADAVIFGFWLSITGNAVRPKWARALRSEIFGYGVHLLKTGATKDSEIGTVPNEFSTSEIDGELRLGGKKKSVKKDDTDKPSNLGLGQIPTSPDYSAVTCEVILRRSGVSLTHLRQLRSASQNVEALVRGAAAASLFAMASASAQSMFLRSGTDLFPKSTVWTARTTDGGTVDLEVDANEARSVLHEAMRDLEAAGLPQANPIELTLSEDLAKIISQVMVSKPKDNGN